MTKLGFLAFLICIAAMLWRQFEHMRREV